MAQFLLTWDMASDVCEGESGEGAGGEASHRKTRDRLPMELSTHVSFRLCRFFYPFCVIRPKKVKDLDLSNIVKRNPDS